MPHRKSGCRFGHGSPACLSMAKSVEVANASATQHSPVQRSQSACRLERRASESGAMVTGGPS